MDGRAGIRSRVERLIDALPPERGPGPDVVTSLTTWIALVAEHNRRIDLTAARDEDALVDLLLGDALVVAAHVPEGARLVDVGAGAGAPGLAIALLRPDLDVTLVEPIQKRVAFLRLVLGTLDRADVKVARERGDTLARRGARFDVAVSRATLSPGAWLALAADLVETGGSAWVLVARAEPPELAGWQPDLDISYRLPLTDTPRRALRYRRGAPA